MKRTTAMLHNVNGCVKVSKLGRVWTDYMESLPGCFNDAYAVFPDKAKTDRCDDLRYNAERALADLRWKCENGIEYREEQVFTKFMLQQLQKPENVPEEEDNSNFRSDDDSSDDDSQNEQPPTPDQEASPQDQSDSDESAVSESLLEDNCLFDIKLDFQDSSLETSDILKCLTNASKKSRSASSEVISSTNDSQFDLMESLSWKFSEFLLHFNAAEIGLLLSGAFYVVLFFSLANKYLSIKKLIK
jgi:hypothetical protein